jgi:hypothetical protein
LGWIVTLTELLPKGLETITVNVFFAFDVGVPESTPLVLRLRPAGKVPLETV